MTLDMTLDTMSKAWSMKERINNLDFIKIQNFCSVKDNIYRMRRQVTDWKKIFAKDTSEKRISIQNIQRTQNSKIKKYEQPD